MSIRSIVHWFGTKVLAPVVIALVAVLSVASPASAAVGGSIGTCLNATNQFKLVVSVYDGPALTTEHLLVRTADFQTYTAVATSDATGFVQMSVNIPLTSTSGDWDVNLVDSTTVATGTFSADCSPTTPPPSQGNGHGRGHGNNGNGNGNGNNSGNSHGRGHKK